MLRVGWVAPHHSTIFTSHHLYHIPCPVIPNGGSGLCLVCIIPTCICVIPTLLLLLYVCLPSLLFCWCCCHCCHCHVVVGIAAAATATIIIGSAAAPAAATVHMPALPLIHSLALLFTHWSSHLHTDPLIHTLAPLFIYTCPVLAVKA